MLKNKKLLLTLLMLFVIAVVATACGSDNNNADNGNNVENNDNGNNNGGETTASGEDVYKDECLSCHGDEGEGASGPKLQGDDFASDEIGRASCRVRVERWSVIGALQR